MISCDDRGTLRLVLGSLALAGVAAAQAAADQQTPRATSPGAPDDLSRRPREPTRVPEDPHADCDHRLQAELLL